MSPKGELAFVKFRKCRIATFLLLMSSSGLYAADADELVAAFDKMYNARLDTATTVLVSGLTVDHQDLNIVLDSGRFAFFEPVIIDSVERYYGGYFEGKGRLRYRPSVAMERDQLKRLCDADSLDRSFDKILLLFSNGIYRLFADGDRFVEFPFTQAQAKNAAKELAEVTRNETRYFIFRALRSQMELSVLPFLMANVDLNGLPRIFYLYDPFSREEVSLNRRQFKIGEDYMEMVCSYSRYIDESYEHINGLSKAQIDINHYNIGAEINKGGDFTGITDVTFDVPESPSQMVMMFLHEELQVDSIIDSSGARIRFLRYREDKHKSEPLYLIFNRPLEAGEIISLTFFYHGDIAKRDVGSYYVTAGARWYPGYRYRSRATFDMRFKTPGDEDLLFVATGRMTDRHATRDTLYTHWVVDDPAYNVSFSIGYMKKYEYVENDVPPVDIYYEKTIHQDLARALSYEMIGSGRNMQDQVAGDIINSVRLFSHYFGPCPHDHLSISEIMALHGEAFPGFIHLGIPTWIKTDSYGHQRAFRAHEVAHQWWGVEVGYQTYHDQWLSEGFAEYCALMYVQTALGNDRFLKLIEEYRKDIFSVRKYLFGGGAEAGPIALGYRTSSSRTEGDYSLIIYKKGSLVLHMLRNMMLDLQTMKEDVFFGMLREFYETFRGRDASTRDFQKIAEKYAGIDMSWFFNQWVYGNDLPTYKFSYELEEDGNGAWTAHCRIITEDVPANFMMYVPIEVEIDDERRAYTRVLVDQPDMKFTLPLMPGKPKKLRLNPFESVLANVKQ